MFLHNRYFNKNSVNHSINPKMKNTKKENLFIFSRPVSALRLPLFFFKLNIVANNMIILYLLSIYYIHIDNDLNHRLCQVWRGPCREPSRRTRSSWGTSWARMSLSTSPTGSSTWTARKKVSLVHSMIINRIHPVDHLKGKYRVFIKYCVLTLM